MRAAFFLIQIVLVMITGCVAAFFWTGLALSVFLGGLLAVLATAVFAFSVLARQSMRPKKILRAFMLGEFVKLLVIAGLFVTALHFFDIQLIAFLVGFLSAYMVYMLSPVLLDLS